MNVVLTFFTIFGTCWHVEKIPYESELAIYAPAPTENIAWIKYIPPMQNYGETDQYAKE
jgi:hypothetical protein